MSGGYVFDHPRINGIPENFDHQAGYTELDKAVELWMDDRNAAIEKYGDINTWDVSKITNFTNLFGSYYLNRHTYFNSDISNWDVSSGTDFTSMFHGCIEFNQDLSKWDVSSGTEFTRMFRGAIKFNQDIGDWDVSSGTNFLGMFRNADSFNQDIGDWDVSSGHTFRYMFQRATAFNQDIGDWDVSNGNSFEYMFGGLSYELENAAFNQDITYWQVNGNASLDYMLMGSNLHLSLTEDQFQGNLRIGTPDSSYFNQKRSLNVSNHKVGTSYQLEYIKDYDGNLHANTGSVSDTLFP